MDHRYVFEAVNRSLKDILSINDLSLTNAPFGGKTILLGGDFRQILPVVPKGKRQDIVLGSINRSHLWDNCQVFLLIKNMRVNEDLTTTASRNKILEFKKWVLDIGDGTVPTIAKDGEIEETWIKIPDEFLIEPEQDPIEKIVTSTYPLFEEMQGNTEYLKERTILAPKNETVNEIKQYMLQFLPGEKNHYLSSDSICKASSNIPDQDNLYPVEFLNTLEFPGIPNHKIELKEGVPIMLLRNVNQKLGMCNGTRLIMTHLGTWIIEAKIITGSNIGTKVFIPRIVLSPTESKWPFILKRRQFPLKICYAMTINKSQGQTLNNVGLYLQVQCSAMASYKLLCLE